MFGVFIRRELFWLKDRLKGSPIKNHYCDIIKKTNECYKDSEQLKNLLEYAIKNVPFYKNIDSLDLNAFPVMTKMIYKENKEMCLSEEYKSCGNLYKAATSGSTGTPLIVYQEKSKKDRVRADLIRAHELIGWGLGEHYIFIRNWVSNYKQSWIKTIAQNVELISITEFDDERKLKLCRHLMRHKKSILFGYASSVCDFMNYVKNNNINTKEMLLKCIVCDSDELTISNKRELEMLFDCPVINRYDNEENGLLAISGIHTDEMIVNYQSLHIELLKMDSDEPAEPGEIGRVVVTDLYNHAMPLIRYDIGDCAVSYDEPGCIRTLKEFSGRKADCIYSTNGVLISSVAISGLTEIFEGIIKYQLTQNAESEYVFKFIGTISNGEDKELKKRLHDCLGNDANIHIECVDDIPVGINGKYKTIVNNIKK